jgi:hypothetical protein
MKLINGTIVDGKYVWNQKKPFPSYYNNDLLKISSTSNCPGINKFYMGDSEEFYKKNLNEMPDDWHYRTKDVTYTLNRLGYRSRELDGYDISNSIVIMGCSITFGVGVSDDETISHYLKEITGRDVINLGVPGGSNQLILNQSIEFKKKYGNPYCLMVAWSTTDRTVYYGDNSWHNIGPWNTILPKYEDPKLAQYKRLYDNLYLDEFNEKISFRYIVNSMRLIWEPITQYTDLSFFEPTAHYGELPYCVRFDNKARDRMHPGYESLRKGADAMVNQIIQKYGDDIIKR